MGRHGWNRQDFEKIPAAMMAMGFGRHWNFDWESGSRRGRGRRRKRVFDSGELRLVLLKLIAEEPRHGYDCIRAIEEMTGGAYAPSPGTVYPTLTLLQDMGLIEEAEAEGARKPFRATAEGEAHLEEHAREAEALIARLREMGESGRKAGGAPIKRAVGNLLAALWHRVTRDDVDEKTLHDIAEILDEAAQRIERLK
ncbi:MAG: PadR family transcriptional regulator [Sphingomonadaceae bacterium]